MCQGFVIFEDRVTEGCCCVSRSVSFEDGVTEGC